MSIDYTHDLAIGFVVSLDDLLKPFERVTEEEFHMEKRFNRKTGAELTPKRVIDVPSQTTYVIQGEEFETEYELFEFINERLHHCSLSTHFNDVGEPGEVVISLSPSPYVKNETNIVVVTLPEPNNLNEICVLAKKELKELLQINLSDDEEPVIISTINWLNW